MRCRTDVETAQECQRLISRYASTEPIAHRAMSGQTAAEKAVRMDLEVDVRTRENASASRRARQLVALATLNLTEELEDDGE